MMALSKQECHVSVAGQRSFWQFRPDVGPGYRRALHVDRLGARLYVGIGCPPKTAEAADSALSARSRNNRRGAAALSKGSTGAINEAEQDAKEWFRANTDAKTLAYVTNFDFNITRSSTTFRLASSSTPVCRRHSSRSSARIHQHRGSATGSYSPVTYTDFYLMLDNSPSMGLGATTATSRCWRRIMADALSLAISRARPMTPMRLQNPSARRCASNWLHPRPNP